MSTSAAIARLVMFLLTVLACLTAPILYATAVRSLTSAPSAQTALSSTAIPRLSPSSTATASPVLIPTVWSAQPTTPAKPAMEQNTPFLRLPGSA